MACYKKDAIAMGLPKPKNQAETIEDLRKLGIHVDYNTIQRVKHALTESVSGKKLYLVKGNKAKGKQERKHLRRFLHEVGVPSETGDAADGTYHSAADYEPTFTFENRNITVSRADGQKLTTTMKNLIHNKILNEMVMVRDSGEASRGRFAFTEISHGDEDHLTITAKTLEARDWLLGIKLGVLSGVELVITKYQYTGVKVDASMYINGQGNGSPEEKLAVIMQQNKHRKGINFSRWTMVDCTVKSNKTFIKLSIDAESAHNLLTSTLNYKGDASKFTHIEPEMLQTCFIEQPKTIAGKKNKVLVKDALREDIKLPAESSDKKKY